MTKPKHTPGPWSLSPARTLVNIKGPSGEQVCQLPLNQMGDADLIVAAHDLLEALKEIAKLEGVFDLDHLKRVQNVVFNIKQIADKAIKKAEVQ